MVGGYVTLLKAMFPNGKGEAKGVYTVLGDVSHVETQIGCLFHPVN